MMLKKYIKLYITRLNFSQNKLMSNYCLTSLMILSRELKKIDKNLSILDMFNFLRHKYLKDTLNLTVDKIIKRAGINIHPVRIKKDTQRQLDNLIKRKKLNWASLKFHFKYRITH